MNVKEGVSRQRGRLFVQGKITQGLISDTSMPHMYLA